MPVSSWHRSKRAALSASTRSVARSLVCDYGERRTRGHRSRVRAAEAQHRVRASQADLPGRDVIVDVLNHATRDEVAVIGVAFFGGQKRVQPFRQNWRDVVHGAVFEPAHGMRVEAHQVAEVEHEPSAHGTAPWIRGAKDRYVEMAILGSRLPRTDADAGGRHYCSCDSSLEESTSISLQLGIVHREKFY
jgi:hypothetical protein